MFITWTFISFFHVNTFSGFVCRTIYDRRHTVYDTGACKLTGEISVQNYYFNSTSVYRYSNILKFNATAPCSNN